MTDKGATPLAQEQLDYQAREKRVMDALSLRKPDRVPIACFDQYFILSQVGITSGEAFYDYTRAYKVYLEEVVKFKWDMFTIPGNFPGSVAEILGLKSYKWAGYNLPATKELQYVEKEYMLADEFDLFLKDPGDFTVRTLLPRMAEGFEPFTNFPPLLYMSDTYAPISEIASMAGRPEVRKMLEKLIRAGEEMNKFEAALSQLVQDLTERGFPLIDDRVIAYAPFDWISDFYRGIKGSMLDMYYQPDKLKAAIDLVAPTIIDFSIKTAQDLQTPYVFIPLHRGADPFMSNDQFGEFYWPGLKELLLAIIDAELIPLPYWEGSYTNRLEFLAELPPGKVWGHFEVIDLKKAKEIIGDVHCFWGNVPSQILISGTPEQTSDYVKELIDTFADNGGLIVDGAIGIPTEAKLENVIAMTETVFEYGTN
jgi:uroporphyrinogen-III decarboxylase